MKTLETITKGETLLTSVRKVNGGKFQIEIAEMVENPNAKVNVASLLNAGDERFAQSNGKPRRAWQSATPEGLLLVGVDVNKLSFSNVGGKEVASVNMLNPTLGGERLHVRLVDKYEPSYEGQAPKQVVDKDGGKTFFMSGGKYIYQSTEIVCGTVEHSIIKSDERVKQGARVASVSSASALNG